MGYLKQSRDGLGLCIKDVSPRWMRDQRQEKYPSVSQKMKKMNKSIARG